MKVTSKDKEERLDFFSSLYEKARLAYSAEAERMERRMEQYRGTLSPSEIQKGVLTVRNITYELIESQVSNDIPPPKVDSEVYSERRERSAGAIEHLLSSLRDKLPFEELNDLDERYTYIYGGSVWLAEWDGADGEIKVSCLSPRDFIPQPNVCNIEDMEYCFLRFTAPKEELTRKYGADPEGAELSQESEDTVAITVCFYRGESGEVSRFVFSGGVTLSDEEDIYRRKTEICTRCGFDREGCRCKEPHFRLRNADGEELYGDIHLSDGRLLDKRDGERVRYYVPRRFPIVVRRNTSTERSLFGQSDCDFIRPQQEAINRIESRILEKLIRAGVTPIMPEDATVVLNNSVFGQLIRTRPGESISQYGTVDTTPDISRDVLEAERLYEHAKRILGISDSYLGLADTAAESGYARSLRISQASGRLESKRKMKHTAYAALDRIIFEYSLAYSDAPKISSYRDAWGRTHNSEFNRYDFLIRDDSGELVYDDSYLFSVDLNGGGGMSRSELWEMNLENLRSGSLGDMSDPTVLLRYWQSQERAHYPYARENVDYFTQLAESGTAGGYNAAADKSGTGGGILS